MSPDAAEAADSAAISGGVFVAVVGPSGAGKDSVIDYARRALAGDDRFVFVRRVVTRPSDPTTEDHDTLDRSEFQAAEARGAFALTWESHGLSYGIPASADARVGSGAVVIANGSRGVVPAMRRRYAHVLVVQITASPEVLAQRLGARGREAADNVLSRLARNADYEGRLADCETIDNSGPLSQAGDAFVALLRSRLPEQR